MALTDTYLAYVQKQLETTGPVTTRNMFGGVGLSLGDLLFALIGQ